MPRDFDKVRMDESLEKEKADTFNPDAFLASDDSTAVDVEKEKADTFNPDAFLASDDATTIDVEKEKADTFNPDAFLASDDSTAVDVEKEKADIEKSWEQIARESGASETEIQDVKKRAEQAGYLGTAALHGGEGVLYGFSAEASVLGAKDYKKHRALNELLLEETQKINPRVALAANVLGTFANPLTYVGGGALAGFKTATKAAKLAKLLKMIGIGATQAGIYGAGSSKGDVATKEGQKQLAKDVAKSMLVGGVTAPIAGAGATYVPKTTAATMLTAIGAPLVTGEESTAPLAAIPALIGLGGYGLSRAAPSGFDKLAALFGQKEFKRVRELAKQGIDFLSPEALKAQIEINASNAMELAKAIDDGLAARRTEATQLISDAYKNTLRRISEKLNFTSEQAAKFVDDTRAQVWAELESKVREAEAKGHKIHVEDLIEDANNTIRRHIERVYTAEDDKSAARNALNALNQIFRVEDKNIKVAVQTILNDRFGGQPTQLVTGVKGVPASEARQYKGLTPEELRDVGFVETAEPKVAFKASPEDFTTSTTTSPRQNVFETTTTGPEGVLLEKKVTTIGQPAADADIVKPTPTIITQTHKPILSSEAETRVFEKLFPGQKPEQLSPRELNSAIVELNDIINHMKSDSARSLLTGIKNKFLDRLTVLVPEAKKNRALYGTAKDVLDVFNLSKEDIAAIKSGEQSGVDTIKALVRKAVADIEQKQDYSTAKNTFAYLKKLNPDAAAKFETDLLALGAEQADLMAKQQTNPLEKVEILRRKGYKPPEQAEQTLRELTTLEKSLGKLSEEVTPTGERLPTHKIYETLADLGQIPEVLSAQREAELKTALTLLRKYDPKLADKVESKYKFDAEILRHMKEIKGPSLSPYMKSSPTLAAQAMAGHSFSKWGAARIGRLQYFFSKNPSKFGKFAQSISRAAARGPAALAATDYMLYQQYPEYRQMLEDLEKEEPIE